ncbi:MAG: HAMP domain-containing histidine kinase, partial [Chitinophagaceae bacterium]|nr:HAMP domain-containing histidine kinase [Chitinophagaceae bacterium]
TNLTEANLFDTLMQTLEIGKTLAAKKAITLNYQIDAGTVVKADTDMLQLVVRNLIHNSIKFTPRGGVINIDTQLVNDKCRISVRDNGTGIPQDKADTLFLMTSGSTFGTNNEKGVGLGLPLCKEFMERQGGSIDFESTPGQGSHFFIFIPVEPAPRH